MTAHAKALPREDTERISWAILVSILVSIGIVLFRQEVATGVGYLIDSYSESEMVSAAVLIVPKPAPEPTVRLDFVPPDYLDKEQLDNIDLIKRVIANPAAEGLHDKGPINLAHEPLQIYLSLLGFENQYRHTDEHDNVAYSYSGCCVGIGMVHLETSVCEQWELFDLKRNIWCSAKIFEGYYNEWAPKAGDRANEITVAMYKNAVVMKSDLSDFKPDVNGLPIIGDDDPTNPMDFFSQVQTVFIDPSTGQSRFKFTPVK